MREQTAVLEVQQAAGGVLGTARRFDEQLGLAAIDRRHVDPGEIAEQEVLSIWKEKRMTRSGASIVERLGLRQRTRRAAGRGNHMEGAADGWLIHDLTVDAPGRATRLRCIGERLWGTAVQRDALQLPIQERDQRPPIWRENWLQAGYIVFSDQRIGQHARVWGPQVSDPQLDATSVVRRPERHRGSVRRDRRGRMCVETLVGRSDREKLCRARNPVRDVAEPRSPRRAPPWRSRRPSTRCERSEACVFGGAATVEAAATTDALPLPDSVSRAKITSCAD